MQSQFVPRLIKQNNRIFGLAAKRGLDHDQLREFAKEVSEGRAVRLSEISFDEANDIIKRLGGDPLPRQELSARTERHRRYKAGIDRIAGADQLKLMRDLAARRGITEDGLERLCRRMLKGRHYPRTSAEVSKIIEAIKAMNKRDKLATTVSPGSIGRAA